MMRPLAGRYVDWTAVGGVALVLASAAAALALCAEAVRYLARLV